MTDEKRRDDEVRCALFLRFIDPKEQRTSADADAYARNAVNYLKAQGLLDAMHRVAVGPRVCTPTPVKVEPSASTPCAHERTWPVQWWIGKQATAAGRVCADCGAEQYSDDAWHIDAVAFPKEHVEPLAPHPLALARERHERELVELQARVDELRSRISSYDVGDRPMSPPARLFRQLRQAEEALARAKGQTPRQGDATVLLREPFVPDAKAARETLELARKVSALRPAADIAREMVTHAAVGDWIDNVGVRMSDNERDTLQHWVIRIIERSRAEGAGQAAAQRGALVNLAAIGAPMPEPEPARRS